MDENTRALVRRLIDDEQGIQHAEEALLLALIAVASITIVKALSGGIQEVFGEADTELRGAY